MLTPILDIENMQAILGSIGVWVFFALYGLIFLIGAAVFWRYRPQSSWSVWLAPHRSPIQIFCLFYILLYTIAYPFFTFDPMNLRFIPTLYCMLLPFAFGLLAQLAGRVALLPLGLYVALTMALMLSPVAIQGLPDWIERSPPYIIDTSNQDIGSETDFKTSGVLTLLQPSSSVIRTTNLDRHFPELTAHIAAADDEVVIITNDIRLFTISDLLALAYFTLWDRLGQCHSRHTVLLVAFDWSTNVRLTQDNARQIVETKCPGLAPQTYDDGKALVYELAPTPGSR